MNQGPTGLQPGALPLSYIPNDILLQRQKLHPGHTGNVLPKVVAVRKGIRTPALIRGPEISFLLPIRRQGFHLESGALDHSAILTVIFGQSKMNIPSGDRTQDLWIRSPTRYPLR